MLENEDNPTTPRPPQPTTPETTADAAPDQAAATIHIPAITSFEAVEPVAIPTAPAQDTQSAPEASDPAPATQPAPDPQSAPATEAPDEPSEDAQPDLDAQFALETQPRPVTDVPVEPMAEIASAPAPQQTPAPAAISALPFVSVDDLLELQIVSDPQISPDGSQIAFTAQRSDGARNTAQSAIWLVSSAKRKGEQARALTGGEHLNFSPRWSPDGQTLAFLSTRSGMPQIHLLPMTGGEPWQLTTLPQGVSNFLWRPDSAAILAQGAWKPADDREGPDTSATSVIYTRLDEQVDGVGFLQGRHQQLWLVPLHSQPTRLTSEPVNLVQACWSPDGTEVVFGANRRPQPDLSLSMALWVLTLATGQMRRLTPEEGLAMMPAWSPDGRSIAYYSATDQTETSNILPWVVDAQGQSAPRAVVPAGEDFTCQALIIDELRPDIDILAPPQWYPNSQALLISVHEHGQVHLYRAELNQVLTQLTSGNGRYITPCLSRNGDLIALVRADWFTPGDIWSLDANGENPRKLTGINDQFLRSRQLTRPKRLKWRSVDDLEIEGWLYLPPLPPGAKAPLILEVHGGPSGAWGESYVHEFQVLAGRGFAVLAANPRGGQGYGEAFCRQLLNDWGNKDLQDLLTGIDHVIATEPIDGERLGIGGLSYGGYMTNWAITQTPRFKAAVSRNSISSFFTSSLLSDAGLWFEVAMGGSSEKDRETLWRERSPLTYAEQITTPLLLLHADNDLRCPFSESVQLFVALRKRRHLVELVRYPGVSHLLDWPEYGTPQQRTDRLRRTVAWFEHFV